MSQTFQTIPETELLEGEIRSAVLPDGTRIALYNIGGAYYATNDTCTHEAASLCDEGMIDGDRVVCSWHFCEFLIATGAAMNSPCSMPLPTYPVKAVGGLLHVEY